LLGESTVTTELAQRLVYIAEFGLDTNYYNTLLQQIAAVSPAQIRALIKSELDPQNEVVVVLADSAHPDKTLKDAGITAVKLGGDGYVRPKFRRRGLGGLLHDAARRDMRTNGIGCMYGAPGAMNLTPLKHGGSREVGLVARWARPLRGVALGVGIAPIDRAIRGLLRPRFVPYLDPMIRDDA